MKSFFSNSATSFKPSRDHFMYIVRSLFLLTLQPHMRATEFTMLHDVACSFSGYIFAEWQAFDILLNLLISDDDLVSNFTSSDAVHCFSCFPIPITKTAI